jgi:4-hydroxyphenylpyruvate dioxygenase
VIRGIDHIELYVGNAYASSYFFTRALGFQPLAEAGLETGLRDRQSFAVAQGAIRLVFTNPLEAGGPIAGHTSVHGDSIRDVALRVDDAASAFERCVAAGLEPVKAPHESSDERGRVRRAAVRVFGDTIHSLIERDGYDGVFLPGFRPSRAGGGTRPASLAAIDHVACCVEAGTLGRWIDLYERAFGMRPIHHEDIVTDHSAMNSKVVGTEDGSVKLPLMEPAHGSGRSQIEEYLDYHHGPGAQHSPRCRATSSVRSARCAKEASSSSKSLDLLRRASSASVRSTRRSRHCAS